LQVRNAKNAQHPTPDQDISVVVREGEEKRVDVLIPSSTPRFARLVVEGLQSFADWKARGQGSTTDAWLDVESSGRIPIDIRGLAYVKVRGANREWDVLIPKDAADGYEVHLALDGRGYEGVVTSQATGRPLQGLRVIARAWNAPEGTAIVITAIADESGHFKLTGLVDDDYSMRFEDMPRTGAMEFIYVRPSARPAMPLTQLTIALPRNNRPLGESGSGGFEGIDSIPLKGVIRKRSGAVPALNGFIGSMISRQGYTMTLYTSFWVAPDGSFDARVPPAPRFVASLRKAETGEGYSEIEWEASGAKDVEVHDIEIP
jgi:hypothetical protein